MVRGLRDEKEDGENEDKEGGGTVGRDGHGQELMRSGGRWMANTVREMRERLKSYYQHLGWEISRCDSYLDSGILKAWLIHENSCF